MWSGVMWVAYSLAGSVAVEILCCQTSTLPCSMRSSTRQLGSRGPDAMVELSAAYLDELVLLPIDWFPIDQLL